MQTTKLPQYYLVEATEQFVRGELSFERLIQLLASYQVVETTVLKEDYPLNDEPF